MNNIAKITLFLLIVIASGCSESKHVESEITKPVRISCSQCPTIQPSQDTLAFVNEVRTFLATNCDNGLMKNDLINDFNTISLGELPIDSYLDVFHSEKGAASIALISRMMHEILLQNGIDSYIYKFGLDKEEHSHSIILFKYNSKICVTDPFINYTMLGIDGTPLDVRELIELIAKEQTRYVTFDSQPVPVDFLVDLRLANDGVLSLLNSSSCDKLRSTSQFAADSVMKMTAQRCFDCDKGNDCFSFLSRFESKLLSETGLNNFIEAFVLKIELVSVNRDLREVDDLIETAIYSQPNLGKRVRKPIN